MTFTEADHAKAVELYAKFKDAEWWPRCHYNPSEQCWFTHPNEFDHELFVHDPCSVIAWAMVERLGNIDLHCYDGWWSDDNRNNVGGPTRFLALAAAIENTHKEPPCPHR